ncbi:hypothetical protein IW262DRAFT_1465802 [Armillaria fumosa]|nr:hypothetical protein IW262DRAFT_1465802 [Armillaria fumosa]
MTIRPSSHGNKLSQTCWMLSGDTKFVSPSNKTGIDYIMDFDHYVARIDELIRKGTRSITDTFQFYNDHVFAPSRTLQSVVPTRVPVSASEEEEAIWKSLEELDHEPDPELEIASIASAPIISGHKATISPPNEPPATNDHSVMISMSPGPAGMDIDVGKTSCSKKKGKKVAKTALMALSRVTHSCGSQPCSVAESSSTDTAINQASKQKGQAKGASVAAQPSRVNNMISPINVPADTVTPTPTHTTTPRVCFADSVNSGENKNEYDEDDEEEKEEEEESE